MEDLDLDISPALTGKLGPDGSYRSKATFRCPLAQP